MKNKKETINAVEMVRNIRNKNYHITKNMTTLEKIEYIHRKAAAVNENLNLAIKR